MGPFGLPRWLWFTTQIAWVALGLFLAFQHTRHNNDDPDVVALGFIFFAILALIAPALKSISVGQTTSVEFKEQVAAISETVVASYTKAITDLAGLIRSLADAE